MSHGLRAFGLPPTPELATDAEISGLFRILESDSTPAESGRARAGARRDDDGDDGCAALPASSLPFDARTSRAFARLARAVAARLNR